jgi:aminopeptidase
MDQDTYCERLAKLAVDLGANVQHDQIVSIGYGPGMEPLVHAMAAAAYERGARFVEATVFDGALERVRLEHAREETLDFVPDWWGARVLALGEVHAARIGIAPAPAPGQLAGIDPQRAAKDQLPRIKESITLLRERSTNWTITAYPLPEWAARVHPKLDPDAAVARLRDELAHILRLDEGDPVAAWRARGDELRAAAARLNDHRFEALRFHGPGTDLTVGLLPSSRWMAASLESSFGVQHFANLPSEEVFTSPDPTRTEGYVASTKPLDVGGTLVEGLRVRFESGRAVEIEADRGADVLRERAAKDDGAARLGEVALVDGKGRIAETGDVFFNTLLDENAASHVAIGNAYPNTTDPDDAARLNQSQIHIDFMIGSNEVEVAGVTKDGDEVPALAGGDWQI